MLECSDNHNSEFDQHERLIKLCIGNTENTERTKIK